MKYIVMAGMAGCVAEGIFYAVLLGRVFNG